MRLHWNGCGLLLHELCHLIHQMTLPKGLDNKVIKQLFLEATNSEMYDNVLRRDWAGMDEVSDLGKHEYVVPSEVFLLPWHQDLTTISFIL